MAFPVDGASSSSPSPSSNASNSTPRWNHQVFLSFRGEDTRKGFTSHLYASLNQKGITTFKDDKELGRGEVISSELIKAIEGSMFAIIVLSPNYACSTWCLDELLKIVECKKIVGQEIIPIFYGVEPSDVRYQRKSFAEAFSKHGERFGADKKKVQRWRDALREVASISGWDSKEWVEADLIESIVKDLYKKLQPKLPYYRDDLVGIDSRVEEVHMLLDLGSHDVRFIGVCGMGGIGKTTIAREVYERIHGAFEVSCFLANVKEVSQTNGLVNIQRQLLSQLKQNITDIFNSWDGKKTITNLLSKKRVLLVLDDVSELSQLKNLAGKEDWFGPGSRVIITTRDMHLLKSHRVMYKQYKVVELNHVEAVTLFCQKAFRREQEREGYLHLIKDVVRYAGGLPLALEVWGSFLCGRDVDEWRNALKQIKHILDPQIIDILKISYDGLRHVEKNIFLDIACFFKGKDKDKVIEILRYCGHCGHCADCADCPKIAIGILFEKCLLTLNNDKLWMHDLLEEMGKNIVLQESPRNPGRRSRLWSLNNVNDVLVKNKGTEAIQGIVLDLPHRYETDEGIALDLPQIYEACLHPDAFSKTSQLKLLKLCKMQLPHGLNCLPSALKVLDWRQCPLKSLPLTIEVDQLVDLKLCHSELEQLWSGTKFLGYLKFINMSFSKKLIRLPDISSVPNLESLVFKGCERLEEAHPSLGLHRKLVLVDFKNCKCLKNLPSKLEMSSMEHLILSGCSKVKRLPEFGESMEHLSRLYLEGTSLKELPLSLGCLIGLVVLNLQDCQNLCSLPNTIQNLKSLRDLNISGCSKLSWLPENLKEVRSLTKLHACGTAIKEVPSCIMDLENLEELSFQGCKGSESKSWNPLLPFWSAPQVTNGFRLPDSLSTFSSLGKLNLSYCNLSDGSIPSDIECLSLLKSLDLSGNNFTTLPSSISELSLLRFLHLNCCKRLRSLPELPINIAMLEAYNSTSLETFKSNSSKQCSPLRWTKKGIFNESNKKKTHFFDGKFHNHYLRFIFWDYLVYTPKFEMTIPGDKIPSWFDTQNTTSLATLLRLQVPHNGPLTEWVGIAFCCVLAYKGYLPKNYPRYRYEISSNVYGAVMEHCSDWSWGRLREPSQPHLSIVYFSAIEFREKFYGDNVRREIKFRFGHYFKELRIIGCGGRLVYEQDFEDWNKTIWSMQQQCLSSPL